MKPKLVVLRGKPTSGKSTACHSLRKRREMKDWVFECRVVWGIKSLGSERFKKFIYR